MPTDLLAYEAALSPHSAGTTYLLARRWELTNTRYLLGPASFVDGLNEQLDPARRRFRIVQRFSLVPKPGIAVPNGISPDQFVNYLLPDKVTGVPDANGPYALLEFTGALPRAGLYSHWQVCPNDPAALQRWLDGLKQFLPVEPYGAIAGLSATDQATLKTLTDTNFDAAKTILLSAPLPVESVTNSVNAGTGTVEFKRYVPADVSFKGRKNNFWKKAGYCYAPTDIMFDAQAAAPSVLLLNDMYDPHWQVLVDGKPAELLRCNFIMRGVFLTPGAHTVEFQFRLPHKPLYVTLAALGIGILLCGFLLVATRRKTKVVTQP
jgi:hypothetical protein